MTLLEEYGGHTPTLSFLDGSLGRGYAAQCKDWTHQNSNDQAQVGQSFSMGDIQLGEGLTADEARDAASLLTGAGTWMEKLAYLTADPMTIQESKRAIAQAIMDC